MKTKDIRVIIAGPIIGDADSRCRLVDKYIARYMGDEQTVNILSLGRPSDTFAEYYANKRNYKLSVFHPDVKRFRDRAYFVRLSKMVVYAKNGNGFMIAFLGGDEVLGTKCIANYVKEQGVKVIYVKSK